MSVGAMFSLELTVCNPSSFRSVPNIKVDNKTVEPQITRGCPKRERTIVNKKRGSHDYEQKNGLQKCRSDIFKMDRRGQGEKSEGLQRTGAVAIPLRLGPSRDYYLNQSLEIQSTARMKSIAEFRVDNGLITTRRAGRKSKETISPIRTPLPNFSGTMMDSNSEFVRRAVTDGLAERNEIEDSTGEDGKEKNQEKPVRRGRQILGSYATNTAIAIQDSLPPEGVVVLISCAVGLMTGACVVLFNLGVHEIHDIVWEGIPNSGALRNAALETTWKRIILVPVGGGVLVGILNTIRTTLESREDKSFWGNTKAFARQMLKTVAAAITLGTGNALGPEGPSVEIGSSIATGVTTVLRNSRERKISLVAAGSAAGIASGFNAAVAGCFFAVESVMPGLSSTDSAPSLTTAMVLLSSVLASVVSQAGLGSDPAFRIPAYDFRSPTELPLYLLLGVLCGGVSVVLTKGSAYATTMFELLQKVTKLPAGFLPPLGGLCVGVIALAYPEILYWGFENVDVLLESHLPWVSGPPAILLVQLVVAKLVATSLCRGSGLVGGVYAPSLFIGAALGSAYGSLASYASTHADPMWHLDVLNVAAPQAYSLVGMAAVLAGVCQVPLTSVLLLFELTRDYRIILPLMAAVGLSSWIASTFQRRKPQAVVQVEAPVTAGGVVSITRFKGGQESQDVDAVLITKSKQLSPSTVPLVNGYSSEEEELCNLEDTLCLTNMEISEDRLTDEIPVRAAMRTKYAALTGDTSLQEAMSKLLAEKEWCVLVVNQDKCLEGLLTLADIQQEAEKARLSGLFLELEMIPISALCMSVAAGGEIQIVTAYPDMTLKAAQRLMAGRGLRQIPVIDRNLDDQDKQSGKLVLGILDREGIRLACRAEATRRMLCRCGPLMGESVVDETNVSL